MAYDICVTAFSTAVSTAISFSIVFTIIVPSPVGLRRFQGHTASCGVALVSPAHLGCSGPSCWAYLGSGLTAGCGQVLPPAGHDAGRLPYLAGGPGPLSSVLWWSHACGYLSSRCCKAGHRPLVAGPWALVAGYCTHFVSGLFGVDVQELVFW